MGHRDRPATRELVGVLPAAGAATRLGPLPCSKEVLPLGIGRDAAGRPRVRVPIDYALETLRTAGVRRAVIVLAPGKDDVSRFLGDGSERGIELSYRRLAASPGAAWSIDDARTWVGDADTALAFPDIRFRPATALRALAGAHSEVAADLWLALVPSTRGDKVDLVLTEDDGAVREIEVKPGPGHEGWTWVTALWSPRFADFLHRRVAGLGRGAGERHIGEFVNDAIAAGLEVRSLAFDGGAARDIGTPEDLEREWRNDPLT
jgi:glucose-1-phosphate thymidylyltransferase